MQDWHLILIGVGLGAVAMLPLAVIATRRTQRRERQLRERAAGAERLAAIGTLTGGLAHEIKNPLSTIGLNLQLLQETLDEADLADPQGGRMRRRIDALTSEVERLRGILEDFLRFTGRMKLDREPTQLNGLVDELVDFYEPQALQSDVRLRCTLAEGLPDVVIDRKLIKQAVLNLLINATQAMVKAKYDGVAHGGADELIIRTEAEADQVVLHVIDTGPGIDEATLERIFEPYFSTKRGGSGLGLATSRRIVEEHGGSLTVHTDPGRGSDFAISLPLNAGD